MLDVETEIFAENRESFEEVGVEVTRWYSRLAISDLQNLS